MKKAQDVKEFVERVDSLKKQNPKDLSSDQDLSIAVMNLISIEEHLVFTGAKTDKTSYYDLIKDIREMRKNLMQKMIKDYEGEVWCISKHLLSSSMRLMEVGTKQQSMGRDKEAYDLFTKAYDLYCLFWGINMNLVDVKDATWIADDDKSIKELTAKIAKAKAEPLSIKDTAPPLEGEEESLGAEAKDKAKAETDTEAEAGTGIFGKLKRVVRKAVDCCIE